MNQIENGIIKLEDLFRHNFFRVPQYQRAYAWEMPQLKAFVDDLVQQAATQSKSPGKRYFLGTLLLHANGAEPHLRVLDVVDGQQRLTTTVVMMATAIRLAEEGKIVLDDVAELRNAFVRDDERKRQRFSTIDDDNLYFKSRILAMTSSYAARESHSALLLNGAADHFSLIPPEQWGPIVRTLRAANVMVYAVDSAMDATQIFELQNDRGKPLTSLESLKSFLMHCIYIHSVHEADAHLKDVQAQFGQIFRLIESLQDIAGAPDEDQVLAAHCVAFMDWKDKEYSTPKQLVKTHIRALTDDNEGAVRWINEFVSQLVESFQAIKSMLDRRDDMPEFTHLYVMGRMASFWPLLLKAWKYDKSSAKQQFVKVCALLEVFSFRGYAIAGIRSNGGQSTFFTGSREFVGDFPALYDELLKMCDWYGVPARFVAALDNPYLYEEDGDDARYLLWRYENYLRDKTGQKQAKESWRSFMDRTQKGSMLTIEHISARTHAMAEKKVKWDGKIQTFAEVALHRLGNLVLDSASMNSAKGAKDFKEKMDWFNGRSSYLSQAELCTFVDNPSKPVWNAEAVRRRHEHLKTFCLEFWNPDKYHTPAEPAAVFSPAVMSDEGG